MGPATFLSGTQLKAWDSRLLVGVIGASRIDLLDVNSAATSATRSAFGTLPAARYRSLVQRRDGNLYIATDTREIWRGGAAVDGRHHPAKSVSAGLTTSTRPTDRPPGPTR